MMAQQNSDMSRMLNDIGIIGFVLVDLTEYLDTHPFDKEAMNYFNHYSRIMKQLQREFSAKYYPLTTSLSESTREWTWVLSPMPWEGGC